MTKRKRTKGQTTINKAIHIKLKIERHELLNEEEEEFRTNIIMNFAFNKRMKVKFEIIPMSELHVRHNICLETYQ